MSEALINQTATGTTTIDITILNKGLYFLQVDGNKAARLLVE